MENAIQPLAATIGDVPTNGVSAGNAQADLWIPVAADRVAWLQAMGVGEECTIQAGNGDGLVLRLRPEPTEDRWPLFIFVPDDGLSYREFSAHLGRRCCYCFRLFGPEELSVPTSEKAPVHEIYGQIKDRCQIPPFMGIRDDPKSITSFRDWLSRVALVICTQKRIEEFSACAAVLARSARDLLKDGSGHLQPPTTLTELSRLLVIRATYPVIARELQQSHQCLELARKDIDEAEQAIAHTAQRQYLLVQERTSHYPDRGALGRELATELQCISRVTRSLAADLQRASASIVQELGRSLEQRLQKRPPTLALIGAYSSGKTTLVNALLFTDSDQPGQQRFLASTIANTAIVVEISRPSENGEAVVFRLRDRVDHVLYDRSDHGLLEPTLARNIHGLIELLDRGVLTGPKLSRTIVPEMDHSAKFQRAAGRVRAKITDSDEVRKELRRLLNAEDQAETLALVQQLYFSAKVVPERVPSVLPVICEQSMPLDDAGWRHLHELTGTGSRTPQAVAATFLIERVEVTLDRAILAHTSIADTPGIGSQNDRHDLITERYLDMAEGFVLLMPTAKVDHAKFGLALVKLRQQLSHRYRGDVRRALRTVAFVANCHSAQSTEDQKRSLEACVSSIRREFGLNDHAWADIKTRCFFAVNLRDVTKHGTNPAELHGYPSMQPLRRWFERVLGSEGQYRSVYESIHGLLTGGWEQAKESLRSERDRLAKAGQSHQDAVQRIERFLTAGKSDGLPEITSAEMRRFEIAREIFVSDRRGGPRESIERALNDYQVDCTNRAALDHCCEALVQAFDELNAEIANLPDTTTWVQLASARARRLGVNWITPESAQIPQALLNVDALRQKVSYLHQQRPGLLKRIVIWLTGSYESVYQVLVDELRTYVNGRRDDVTGTAMNYIEKCQDDLRAWHVDLTERCRSRISALRTKPEREQICIEMAGIDGALDKVERLETGRRQVLKRLSDILR